MPPKKDTSGGEANELLVGFTDKETKLIAAAFLSSTGPDKFDYETMAALTKNTAGSLKKMWPPVKRKAMESHPSFAKLLGQSNGDATAASSTSEAPKLTAAPKSRKRKPADEASEETTKSEPDSSEPDKKPAKKKATTAAAATAAATKKGRGRPKKQAKIEITDEENSADGGDGRGEFTKKKAVQRWLRSTDYE
ncbi:hypothetical protein COCMIDRAFT_84431 [Bipolaris oryzae ATCC 44560]|uniref:Uncharacterized protein n=1 Tax=Bipolaris oryzae ATCC 44560 TaxID=930090 RepID=W7A0B6_COCMI|nr:uncharacterized protein COCMIDRAFT_84431 [Bipolaris oryzae ATCC 44560]EUC49466.1 hypothetical protein COCMIDRAFT_84431 [Bipolaris oryzae ATCC 44560]